MQDSEFVYSLQDIIEQTGLDRKWVDRFYEKFPHLLAPYRQKKENNKIFYNQSGLAVWTRATEMKAAGNAPTAIGKMLDRETGNVREVVESDGETSRKKAGTVQESGAAQMWAQMLEKAWERACETERKRNEALESKMLLLTDGRPPEEVRAEWNQKRKQEKQRVELLSELDTLQRRWTFFDKPRRQKEIVQQLKDLDA